MSTLIQNRLYTWIPASNSKREHPWIWRLYMVCCDTSDYMTELRLKKMKKVKGLIKAVRH